MSKLFFLRTQIHAHKSARLFVALAVFLVGTVSVVHVDLLHHFALKSGLNIWEPECSILFLKGGNHGIVFAFKLPLMMESHAYILFM